MLLLVVVELLLGRGVGGVFQGLLVLLLLLLLLLLTVCLLEVIVVLGSATRIKSYVKGECGKCLVACFCVFKKMLLRIRVTEKYYWYHKIRIFDRGG